MVWNYINKICCLVSSHIYLFMAAYLSKDLLPEDNLYKLDLFFETFFAISMVLEFLTDFEPVPGQKAIRDLVIIANRYIKGEFIYDLIALVPFNFFIDIDDGYERLFYLFKLLRLQKGFKLFNVA